MEMLHVESTQSCIATPRIAFALEEAGVEYAVVRYDDGHFRTEHGRIGPRLVGPDGGLFEVGPIMRHVGRLATDAKLLGDGPFESAQIDSWIDVATIRISMPFSANLDAPLRLGLDIVERALGGRDWLSSRFTLADCAMGILVTLRRAERLGPWPRLTGYAERLASRPAWVRAQRRVNENGA